ncbi:DUF523 domain-containing protein [Vogesella sp. DC21W]|uniref:DUF523 domain-containing protein n=1 Tax=Vogesella aquatica TaxID=2984206 RepID=A0ABT5J150_9NEIS|nr:DUF523 domain-containing protein [Vogesella aquatica]MDC7718206.1 DUF523 domain-containing protein [Vogesella aquatica]
MTKPALLISACLLGQPVRYDGASKGMNTSWQQQLAARYALLPFCPECAGGLPTPRPAAEIYGGHGRHVLAGQATVHTASGGDVSAAFIRGARLALALAQQHGCTLALLKANSPSCGNRQIYSGLFDGQLQEGAGVCAALLQQHGITVYNETELAQLL